MWADVARAFLLALDIPKAAGGVFNIGSGEDRTVEEVAALLAEAMDRRDLPPEIAGKARAGDIRHCIPDIDKAATNSATAAGGISATASPNSPNGWRGRRRRTGSARRGANSKRGGWSR